MQTWNTKTVFIQKPYLREVQDHIEFKWLNPQKLERLDYYTANFFKEVRRADSADVSRVYHYLKMFNGVLPKNCSHDWLHRYLVALTKQGFIKMEYGVFQVSSPADLLKAQNWPGVTTDVYTHVGSTLGVPKFYGIDSNTPTGTPVYDSYLNIFATAVP